MLFITSINHRHLVLPLALLAILVTIVPINVSHARVDVLLVLLLPIIATVARTTTAMIISKLWELIHVLKYVPTAPMENLPHIPVSNVLTSPMKAHACSPVLMIRMLMSLLEEPYAKIAQAPKILVNKDMFSI